MPSPEPASSIMPNEPATHSLSPHSPCTPARRSATSPTRTSSARCAGAAAPPAPSCSPRCSRQAGPPGPETAAWTATITRLSPVRPQLSSHAHLPHPPNPCPVDSLFASPIRWKWGQIANFKSVFKHGSCLWRRHAVVRNWHPCRGRPHRCRSCSIFPPAPEIEHGSAGSQICTAGSAGTDGILSDSTMKRSGFWPVPPVTRSGFWRVGVPVRGQSRSRVKNCCSVLTSISPAPMLAYLCRMRSSSTRKRHGMALPVCCCTRR